MGKDFRSPQDHPARKPLLPASLQGDLSSAVYGGVRSPRPTEAPQVVRSSGPMWSSAPTERRASHINHPGQRRTAERLRRGREGWVEIAAEITPKGASNPGQFLSRPPGDSSLYTREPWGRGCGLPRRPCGPPRNDDRFLPFRGAERRGNPSFLRWTGVRAAEVVGPYGKPDQPPKPAGTQRSVCAAVTRSKRESAQRPSKRGSPPRPPRQRLAKRKARG